MRKLVFAGLVAKGNIHQKEDDQKQGAGYLGVSGQIQKIVHSSKSSSIFATAIRNIIPKIISLVNPKKAGKEEILIRLGVMKATANQPADRLINSPDRALNQALVKNISMRGRLAASFGFVKKVIQPRNKIATLKSLAMTFAFFLLFTLAFLLNPTKALAATCTWNGGSASYNTNGNWSCGHVPNTSDVATFDSGTSNASVTIDTAVDVLGWNMTNSYSGTITQGANAMTIRGSGWTQSTGTFTSTNDTLLEKGEVSQ